MTERRSAPWSDGDIELLKKYYPNEATAGVAKRLGRSVGATYAKATALGVRKSEEFKSSELSGRLRGNARHRTWTEDQLDTLRKRYSNEKTETIAKDLGRTTAACYARAAIEGLSKTAEFLSSPDAGRTDGTIGQGSRFRKGHVPVNKGRKGWQAGGRSEETRFKKGHRPKNYCPIGTYRKTTKEKFWVLKVQEHGTQRERWIPLHKLVWIEHHGPIPDKHVIRFKDGDVENVTVENLECISMTENMRRNTVHNLPKPLVEVIRTKGVLTRQINKRRKEINEKQD